MVFRKSRRIAQDAHAAAVRIYSEDLTESERLAIEARCEQDPVFNARFVEAHHLLGALDDWRDELREDSLYRATYGKHRTGSRRIVRNVVAPGLVAGVVLGFSAWFVATQYSEDADAVTRYATQVGEQRTLTLEDGSTVTLNTRSQILVGMTDNVRRVVMDRGEAYFEVAPDPLRPFTVEVGGQSITARGTEFNLRRNGDGFALALIDGRLALHRQGREPPADPPWLDLRQHPVENGSLARDEFGLVAGAVVDFNAHDQTFAAHHDSNVARRQQWRQGRLTFIDEPMARVVAELSRYSEKPIRIHDPKVGDIRVFATLRLDSIDEALTTLENAVPIRVVPTLTAIAVLAAETESNALH
ncbi:MAG: DUF4974 domain-containing protein [Gammaproteobacteria bacterium]|nr:DUF4974 domain-containing protein [Gammaproteobacteria bacterium]MYF30809.1 DUF4974 domain-containing protein [Gammaproteobacteria bacterium]MYK44724.1 DUF4974 domain-containing protein [Gammaproteobacteria bacterium]